MVTDEKQKKMFTEENFSNSSIFHQHSQISWQTSSGTLLEKYVFDNKTEKNSV